MNKLLIATTLSVILLPAIAFAEITYGDVTEKMKAGDVKTAEMFTKQILKDHPGDAKAHYYMGQILGTEGDYKGSYKELKKAADLDKSLGFASNPARFRDEMDRIEVNLGKAPAPEISSQKESGFGWGTLFMLLSAGGLVYWYVRSKPKPETKKAEQPYRNDPAANHPSYARSEPRNTNQAASPSRPTNYAPSQAAYASPAYTAPHVVNNYNSGNDGLVEGMLLGSMLSGHSNNNTIIDRETIIDRSATNTVIQDNDFDSGSKNSPIDTDFDDGAKSSTDFDSGSDNSSSFDSGSSSFDSGSSSFDSGSSSGGDSN